MRLSVEGWRQAAEAYVADSPVGARRNWGLIHYLRWRAGFTDRLLPQLAVDLVVLNSRPDPASWQEVSGALDRTADRWLRRCHAAHSL